MRSEQLARCFTRLRFPLTLGVLAVHAYARPLGIWDQGVPPRELTLATERSLDLIVRELVAGEIGRLSTPLFFVMSAFLLFRSFESTPSVYLAKIRTRVQTLLVPFLFWNVATLLLFALSQSVPALGNLTSGRVSAVLDFSPSDFLRVILGIGETPIATQFWFLRDLMLLVLFAPLVWMLRYHAPVFTTIALLFCWLTDWWPWHAPSARAALFFWIGCWCATSQVAVRALTESRRGVPLLYAAMLVLIMSHQYPALDLYLHRIGVLVGCVAAIQLAGTPKVGGAIDRALGGLASVSFFVFAAHAPVVAAVRKSVGALPAPTDELSALMYSAALPVASVAILFVMYTVLARLLPRFLSVVTGERSAKLTSKIGDSVPGADGHSSNYLDWRARRNNRPAQAS